MKTSCLFVLISMLIFLPGIQVENQDWDFDRQREAYFKWQVEQIENESKLTDWNNLEEFHEQREEARKELLEMLGLSPLPIRSDLNVKVTGIVELDSIIVEKIVFEAVPGLYITANVYRPKFINTPLPAILYVCGHATVKTDTYSYGSKVHYQHHPTWYAKNGYICIILDTIQLGEIEGIHHGTYRHNRWWWISRGFTPAGVEAWSGIRAIDYLTQRSDVDVDRIGITGRSGGGATSWWVAALDDRVQVVAPISGITDMHNQVIDACVAKHCDCMFFLNIHRWDFSKIGLLIAPRPLLIGNADRDPLFPLDGVIRVHNDIMQLYEKLGKEENLALNIVGGGHQDIQDIQIPTFRWFNFFLQGHKNMVQTQVKKYFQPEELRVFKSIPEDEVNSRVDQYFVGKVSMEGAFDVKNYETQEAMWMENLTRHAFKAWQILDTEPQLQLLDSFSRTDATLHIYRLQTDQQTALPILFLNKNNLESGTNKILVKILDDHMWNKIEGTLMSHFSDFDRIKLKFSADKDIGDNMFSINREPVIFLPMRGSGPASFSGNENDLVQIKRTYALLGQTLELMQTWDLIQGLESLKSKYENLVVEAHKETATMLIYASIFSPNLALRLKEPLLSHNQSVAYPAILRYVDVPMAILMSARRNEVKINGLPPSTKNELTKIVNASKDFQLDAR